MSVRLIDTNASAVESAIAAERFHQGASAVGRVLTLVIVADEATQADSVRAAAEAAQEHPCRILVVIPRRGRGLPQLDATIWVGGSDGLGELVELRMRGPLAHHLSSVVLPLLVPDAPVVVWWPGVAPERPSEDGVGRLAQRRITDAAAAGRPLVALDVCRAGYSAGDTDLAWTRITPWRALLAAALDQPLGRIRGVTVAAQRSSPSAPLLAAWLQRCLGVPATLRATRGPGITEVRLHADEGDLVVTRPDGRSARVLRPDHPDRDAVLPRRTTEALIAEELRRLDPDEIYGEVLEELPRLAGWVTTAAAHRVHRAHLDGIDETDGVEDVAADRAARRSGAARTSPARKAASAKAAAPKAVATKAASKKAVATKAASKKAVATKPAATKATTKAAATKASPTARRGRTR